MENQSPRARRTNEPGPTGRRAARNLEELRDRSGLSQDQLATAAERLGRPMTRQIVSKTEAGDRRIDVDDLVTFALALRSTPNRLLLTRKADVSEAIELVPSYEISELAAWMWATGEHSLPNGYEAPQLQMVVEDD